MHSIRSISTARVALFALLALAPRVGWSAPDSKPAEPTYTITLDFPGGPLSKLVEILKADPEANLSIINPQKLDPALPPFSVRNQSNIGLIGALSQVLRPQGYVLNMTTPGLAVLTTEESSPRKEGFAAFQLGSHLNHLSIEQITVALQAACEFAGVDGAKLRFRFHQGTGMLFVAGPQMTIDQVVRQVIANLPQSPTPSAPPADNP